MRSCIENTVIWTMTELPKTITRSTINSSLRSAGINYLYAETAKEAIELLSHLNAMTKFTEYQIVLLNIALYHSQSLDSIIEACESVSLPLLVIVPGVTVEPAAELLLKHKSLVLVMFVNGTV